METVHTQPWGQVDGKDIFLYTLKNSNGMEMKITNYGAIVQSLFVPDANGKATDVVLGYDSLEEYTTDPYFMGAIVGRYSGRIANGKILINGSLHNLSTTGKGFHHHGGQKGFNKMVWSARTLVNNGHSGLELSYLSQDKEEGFPGNLHVTVTYTLNDLNEWKIDIKANTDQPTVLNLTQHSYFNLGGYTEKANTILDHLLTVHTGLFLPVHENVIPTGEMAPVSNTPFDFSKPLKIGERILSNNQQLHYGQGYDHSYVLKKENNDILGLAATLQHPENKMRMQVFTTEPSIHVYSGNFLNGSIGKNGVPFKKQAALCLETQHFSDSPNKPHFPSTMLEPGEQFESTTVYKFN
jgi:aldose 1-epimerase